MKKFKCPYCYEQHDIRTSGIKCSYNIPGKPNVRCFTNVKKDTKGWIIADKDKMKCLKCKHASVSVYCNSIEKTIPRVYIEEGKSLSIALLGARNSGKSNYIGVLVNEIRKKMVGKQSFNCSLDLTASEESNEYYNRYYYNRLFNEGLTPISTIPGEIPPLIFPLRFLNNKKVAALTFYDTAGENLDSQDTMEINNRYISNADGIVLLLDPLQIPSIRDRLRDKISDDKEYKNVVRSQNTDITEVLSRIIQNIRNMKKIKGTIKIPVALVFTKIDALEKYGLLSEGSCLLKESEHLSRGVFVRTDFESVNIEMQTLLENWLDAELIQLLKNFEKFAFFGITALGAVPNGEELFNGKVNPRRVLDPLLWILAEKGYIKKVRR